MSAKTSERGRWPLLREAIRDFVVARDEDRATRVAAIYAKLPRMTCQGKCQQACGLIGMTGAEHRLITLRLGRDPARYDVSPAAFGLPETDFVMFDDQQTCPLLNQQEGTCTIYEDRPLICRLFGMVDHLLLRCACGCVPDRWVTHGESHALLNELHALEES